MTIPSPCFADPLGGLSDQDWNELAGPRFYSSALWSRLCALAPGAVPGGLHVDLPGGGRAAVPVAAVRDEPNPHCRWQDQLARRGLPVPPPRGILIGQRRGYLTHVLSTPGASRAQAARGILDAVRSMREPERVNGSAPAARIAMFLTTPDVRLLREAGVDTMPVALSTDAWIEIPPGGWESWLDSLGSRHRARRVRSEVRRFARAGYRVWHRTLHEAHRDVARLMARTEARYGRHVDVDALSRSFRRQGELAGDRAEVLLCGKEDGAALGLCLYYRWQDTVYLRAVGFDYENLSGAAEYFNLTYYLPARLPGIRWLHAGIETPEAKAGRGATLRPLWLLDLSEHSVLSGHDRQVRRHNHAYLTGLRNSSPLVAGALDDELWQPFCEE
ncbi:MAG TPA: hypothetical protein VFV67_09890 [Actinophytocola sp.]|uniref:hypothetical protein n=1 Tax=Actinophytocola sp. TaxID=1872138 RepID=UPI002DB6087F|nr:hypothetical protein [Actinophytocola sp.]HEU5470951.1 hypothetical protein [Actinophytocola sp.]